MNRTEITLTVFLILVVLGGVAFLLMESNHANTAQNAETAKIPYETQKSSTMRMSRASMLTMIGNQVCTYSDKKRNSSGTVYIGDEEVRGDFQNDIHGTLEKIYVINNGKNVYMWIDENNAGSLLSLGAFKNATKPNDINTPTQTFNLHEQSDYSCSPWSVDEAKFTIPQNITFKSINE